MTSGYFLLESFWSISGTLRNSCISCLRRGFAEKSLVWRKGRGEVKGRRSYLRWNVMQSNLASFWWGKPSLGIDAKIFHLGGFLEVLCLYREIHSVLGYL